MLRDHLDTALAGRGGLVLIGGEAGLGKTALAEALCAEAERRGVFVLVGRCFDRTETPAYGPWLTLFERYQPTDGSPLGSIPPRPAAFAVPGVIGEVTSQPALFRQVLDFLKGLTAQRAAIVLLDDMHWADAGSLDLLRFLAQSVAPLPVLVLVIYRSDELSRRHPLYSLLPQLVRESAAERVDLRALDTSAVRELIDARYHLTDEEAARLMPYLHARAEGNALFLGELLRSLEEMGTLRQEGGRWQLDELLPATVPPLLRQVIDGRVSRLDEEHQRLLAVAAVIGHDVLLDVWAAVGAVDEDVLLDCVEQAEAARLLKEMPDGRRVQFAHALVREALYEGIPATRRRRLHRVAAEALAALPGCDPDTVADHFQRAGDARAVEWLIAAGERAQRAYAWTTATERYEAALALLKDSDDARTCASLLYRVARLRRFFDPKHGVDYCDEAERLAALAGDRSLVAVARFSRGHCRWYLDNDFDRALREIREGADLLEALPPSEQERLGCPPDEHGAPTIALCRGQVVLALESKGRYREAIALGESYPPVAPALATLGELGRSHYGDREQALATSYALLGRPGAAREAFATARTILRDAEHYATLGQMIFSELRMVTLAYHADRIAERHRLATEGEEAWQRASASTTDLPRLAWMPVIFLEGEWAEARAVAVGEAAGNLKYQREWAMGTLGPLARAQGEPESAWTYIRELLPAGPGTAPGTMDFYETSGLLRLAASLALDANDLATAHAWLTAHDTWLVWSGAVLGRAEGDLLWGQYHRARGDAAAAQTHAHCALAHATAPRQPLALLAVHRLLGELDTDAGRYNDAANHLGSSLALADACAAPYERALTLLALAELRATQGDGEEVQSLLAEARAICERLGAKPALARADAIAAHVATMDGQSPAYPAGLSPREIEVLRLLAVGRTNRDIADALFLSEHTVRVHVRNILTKTDTDNRTAAAAFARDTGLA